LAFARISQPQQREREYLASDESRPRCRSAELPIPTAARDKMPFATSEIVPSHTRNNQLRAFAAALAAISIPSPFLVVNLGVNDPKWRA